MKGARSNRVTLRGHNRRLMATEPRRSIHVVSASKKKTVVLFSKEVFKHHNCNPFQSF